MHGFYTCVIVSQWSSLLSFSALQRSLVPCHMCVVHIGVVVFVGPPSEVAQGPLLKYPPSEIVWGSFSIAALHLEVVDLVE